jgi:hypothetical protein
MNHSPPPRIRLDVPRHLQDYNGYCGPACAMMVVAGESEGLPVALHAQQDLFREIRQHAKANNDKRPIKSPAESLIAVLHSHSRLSWRKCFDADPRAIARRILESIERAGQPAIILVSKGMHWVVAFGRTLKEDGSVAGVLLRDPAWAGMPKFFGLTVYPEKGTFEHGGAPCKCLLSDQAPASVHERYIAMDELLSPRGLHGSPDWEGNGAIAIVPESNVTEATSI